ncbi:MAG TPA: tryptophan--tRNA ligase, partial [Desulfotignum sp.]|nr:tryptophan--tRNA ligase [Desulfotignum sp.]
QELFEYINTILAEPRQRYNELVKNPGDIEDILSKGADKARGFAVPFLKQIRSAIGIRSLG